MTNTTITSQNTLVGHRPFALNKLIFLFLAFFAAHAVYLFFISDALFSLSTEATAQFTYLGIRVLSWIAITFFLTYWVRLIRFQALAMTCFFEAINHIIIKGAWMKHLFNTKPEMWAGMELNTVLFQLPMSFFVFLPIIVIFSFVGWALGAQLLHSKTTTAK